MYDIVIVGAGPAGATLARLLDRKFRVMVIDKRNLHETDGFIRGKCCGGLLAPAAQKALARQGIGVPEEVLRGPQTFSVKSMDFDNSIEKYYQRHYINMDREKFDRWLVSLIPDSVELVPGGLFKSVEKKNGGFLVSFLDGAIIRKAECRVIIGADGASSAVRRQVFGEKHTVSRYISMQEHYKTERIYPYYFSVFDREVTDFYSWLIQKGDELLVGAALEEGRGADEKFRILINKLKKIGVLSGEPVKKTGAIINRPRRLCEIKLASNGAGLIGEAAGLISPSSAEGISYALESGRNMAECLNKGLAGFEKAYRKSIFKLKVNLIYKKLKVVVMYSPFLRKIVMKSGLISMDVSEGEADD